MQLQMLDLELQFRAKDRIRDQAAVAHSGQNDTQDNKPRKRKQHPAATNCLPIWNALTRLLPARPRSVSAASAAARPA